MQINFYCEPLFNFIYAFVYYYYTLLFKSASVWQYNQEKSKINNFFFGCENWWKNCYRLGRCERCVDYDLCLIFVKKKTIRKEVINDLFFKYLYPKKLIKWKNHLTHLDTTYTSIHGARYIDIFRSLHICFVLTWIQTSENSFFFNYYQIILIKQPKLHV